MTDKITIRTQEPAMNKQAITHYCLGNGASKCAGCGQEKNWQTLNQMPDALRKAMQAARLAEQSGPGMAPGHRASKIAVGSHHQ